MRIGIIGSGHVGGTLARLLARAGHDVAIANSRGPDSLRDLVAELAPHARAATVDDAARWGEVVVLATPWRAADALPSPATVRGTIVVDAMNPYDARGKLVSLGDDTSSEVTARRLPDARVVKAFNTIRASHLQREGDATKPLDARRAIFVAGDDDAACAVVSRLIEEIGFAPVYTGGLREGGRRQAPGGPVFDRQLTAAEAAEVLAARG